MVKVLDELTTDQKVQAEKDKADGKGSRRKALPATYGPLPPLPCPLSVPHFHEPYVVVEQ